MEKPPPIPIDPLGSPQDYDKEQNVFSGGQAPPFLEGLRPLDPREALAKATPSQVNNLMRDNFALWAKFSGLRVDNHPFDFDNHRYLLPIYLDQHKHVTLIKAAQMGATVYMLLFLLWYARYHEVKCGLYFPTADGVTKLSKDRLGPLLLSSKELETSVSNAGDTLGLKQINNIYNSISSLYLLYLGGQATKDSVPLDVVCFDEVRLLEDADMDQALERVSHSTHKVQRYMSTAGLPGETIDRKFLQGNQLYWHVKCGGCLDGFVPSDHWPDCIVDFRGEVYLRCPRCKNRIHDNQIGNYIAHNPKADQHSYHISQLVSKYISPKEIWQAWLTTTNKKEFFNAKLGRPYVDAENQPVTEALLMSCVNPDIHWATDWESDVSIREDCAIGVDQMGGFNYIIVLRRGTNGKRQLVHFEIVEMHNPKYWENGEPVTPFKRLYEMMAREYPRAMMCIDALPNYNEATDLARAFPGRVYLAHYGEAGVDMIKWHDRIKMREQLRKGSKEIKLKWQVTINRYQGIDYALQQWVDHEVEMPHPDRLIANVRNEETGRFEAEGIAKSKLFKHMSSLVRQAKELDPDTGKTKMQWVQTAGDPHTVHAFLYALVAYERMKRTPQFSIA